MHYGLKWNFVVLCICHYNLPLCVGLALSDLDGVPGILPEGFVGISYMFLYILLNVVIRASCEIVLGWIPQYHIAAKSILINVYHHPPKCLAKRIHVYRGHHEFTLVGFRTFPSLQQSLAPVQPKCKQQLHHSHTIIFDQPHLLLFNPMHIFKEGPF